VLLQVSVLDDEGIEVAALQRWLAMDPDVRGGTATSYAEDDGRGGMGPTLDIVNVVLSNGVGVGTLLAAIAGWRRSRTPAPGTPGPEIVVRRGDVEIVLGNAGEEEIARAARALTTPDDPPGPVDPASA